MNQYEVTFIVDPVLSDSEIKATSSNYVEHLKNEGCTIVHVDEIGLKQLAYAIKKRNSGFYYTIEFQSEKADFIAKLELALRRDERIMRFLTVKLDKFGIKYNEDKRNGLINKRVKKQDTKKDSRGGNSRNTDNRSVKPKPSSVEKVAAPVAAEAAATETVVAKKEEAPVAAVVAETVVAEKEEAPAAPADAETVVAKKEEVPVAAAATETVVAEKVEAPEAPAAAKTVVAEKVEANTEVAQDSVVEAKAEVKTETVVEEKIEPAEVQAVEKSAPSTSEQE